MVFETSREKCSATAVNLGHATTRESCHRPQIGQRQLDEITSFGDEAHLRPVRCRPGMPATVRAARVRLLSTGDACV